MLLMIFLILLLMWLLGFTFNVGGGLIHLLLLIALIMLIVRLAEGRRTVV